MFVRKLAITSLSLASVTAIGCAKARSFAIPEKYPLGTVVRAHNHVMQTNAEASDFILHRNEFVDRTAQLTPAGKDHVLEIAMRMRQSPFPVVVERSENNSDPELDQHRRNMIARVLVDLGNTDAEARTFVSPAYGPGLNSREAELDYYRYLSTRGTNGFGNNGNNGQFGGGFGANGGGFGF